MFKSFPLRMLFVKFRKQRTSISSNLNLRVTKNFISSLSERFQHWGCFCKLLYSEKYSEQVKKIDSKFRGVFFFFNPFFGLISSYFHSSYLSTCVLGQIKRGYKRPS